MKKNFTVLIIVFIIVAGGSFYGGMKFQQSQKPAAFNRANFANVNGTQRQQFAQNGGGMMRGGGQNGGFLNGDIISKDDKSLTIKLNDGSTKIIFYSDATQVGKFDQGTPIDLVVGQIVSVTGQANQDGSVSAQNIQIRPATLPGQGGSAASTSTPPAK